MSSFFNRNEIQFMLSLNTKELNFEKVRQVSDSDNFNELVGYFQLIINN